METNFLKAFSNLVNTSILDIKAYYQSRNRINNVGEALEYYVKDLFCNSFEQSLEEKNRIYSQAFSYLGNQNNPPDIIVKSGDAIEVKKVEGMMSGISLNSSYPKDRLYSDSPMITASCRDCEDWSEKDLLYTVGTVLNDKLKSLFFVYGNCYAADRETYERIRNKIAEGINELSGVGLADTRELGRVNKVDPLGITYLRIRGMWGIDNPAKVFSYIPRLFIGESFNSIAILTKEKYLSFPEEDRIRIERLSESVNEFSIREEKIKSPNNPASMLDCKILVLSK